LKFPERQLGVNGVILEEHAQGFLAVLFRERFGAGSFGVRHGGAEGTTAASSHEATARRSPVVAIMRWEHGEETETCETVENAASE
jgi:hypothetical protein